MSLFDEYVCALGEELGISLEPEASQVDLEVDDLRIHLRYDDEDQQVVGLVSVHDLGENPTPQQQASLCVRCLEGQYCFGQTASFSLGLSPDDRTVVLQGQWKLTRLSDRKFIDSFEAFVQTAKLCAGVLSESEHEAGEALPGGVGESTFDMLRV